MKSEILDFLSFKTVFIWLALALVVLGVLELNTFEFNSSATSQNYLGYGSLLYAFFFNFMNFIILFMAITHILSNIMQRHFVSRVYLHSHILRFITASFCTFALDVVLRLSAIYFFSTITEVSDFWKSHITSITAYYQLSFFFSNLLYIYLQSYFIIAFIGLTIRSCFGYRKNFFLFPLNSKFILLTSSLLVFKKPWVLCLIAAAFFVRQIGSFLLQQGFWFSIVVTEIIAAFIFIFTFFFAFKHYALKEAEAALPYDLRSIFFPKG